jgi:hypothetical protein
MKLKQIPILFLKNLCGAFVVSVLMYTVSMSGTPRHLKNYIDLLLYSVPFAVPATAIAATKRDRKPTPLESAQVLARLGYISPEQFVNVGDAENHKQIFGE